MTIPAATFIESAVEQVKQLTDQQKSDQRWELATAVGQEKATESFMEGYELGLETARVLISMGTKP